MGRAGRIQIKNCVNDECTFQFARAQEDSYEVEHIFSEGIFGTQIDLGFDQPGYIGADLKRFHFNRPPRSFKYFGDRLDESRLSRYSKIAWKDSSLYSGEKLLMRKVSSGNLPTIMIHEGTLIFNQQIYCFQRRNRDNPISLKFYLAVIGSRLFHYYFVKNYTDPDKETLPHFTQSKILSVPVPSPSTTDQNYIDIVNYMDEILELIQRIIPLSTKLFTNFLSGYPHVAFRTFYDIYSALPPTERQFFTVEYDSLGNDFRVEEEGDFLVILGYTEGTEIQVLKIRLETESVRKFLHYFLHYAKLRGRGNFLEKLNRIEIPVFSRDNSENEEIIEELISLYNQNEEQKRNLKGHIKELFHDLDSLILTYYNITDPQHFELITKTANNNGFIVF